MNPKALATHWVGALLATAILAFMSALSLWWQAPIIMPSIASAVLTQTMAPKTPSARLWNTGVGQIVGAAGGFIGVYLGGAAGTPHFLAHHPLVDFRLFAIVIAIAITALVQPLLKATSPAGGATALVVAAGVELATWDGAGRLLAGIVVVTALGEVARLIVLRMQKAEQSG